MRIRKDDKLNKAYSAGLPAGYANTGLVMTVPGAEGAVVSKDGDYFIFAAGKIQSYVTVTMTRYYANRQKGIELEYESD